MSVAPQTNCHQRISPPDVVVAKTHHATIEKLPSPSLFGGDEGAAVVVRSLEDPSVRCSFRYSKRVFGSLKVGSRVLLVPVAVEDGLTKFRARRVRSVTEEDDVKQEFGFTGTIHTVIGANERQELGTAAFVAGMSLLEDVLLWPRALQRPFSDGTRFLLPNAELLGRRVGFDLIPDTYIIGRCRFIDPPDFSLCVVPASIICAPPTAKVGCWTVTVGSGGGCTTSTTAVDPAAHVIAVYKGTELVNALPPLLSQGVTLQLTISSPLLESYRNDVGEDNNEDDVEVTIAAIADDGEDYTEEVCKMEIVATSRAVVARVIIKEFEIGGDECEMHFRLAISVPSSSSRGASVLELTSVPFFIKRGSSINKDGNHTTVTTQDGLSDAVSFKYWTTDFLGPADRIESGFKDPGRSNEFRGEDGGYDNDSVVREREVILIDRRDSKLQDLLERAKEVCLRIMDTRARSLALGWFVSCTMGGPAVDESRFEQLMADLRGSVDTKKRGIKRPRTTAVPVREARRQCNTVMLGTVTLGLCRHRALLYKFLADRMHIPACLVRGFYVDAATGERDRHSWNVVCLEDGASILIDTMLASISVPEDQIAAYVSSTSAATASQPDGDLPTQYHLPRPDQLIKKEEIGRGATSVVHRILFGGMTCALKVAKTPADRVSLIREFNTLKSLKQKDTVSYSSVVQTLGWRKGLLLEYMPHSLLSFMNQLLLRKQRLGSGQIAQALFGVAHALQECHERGIVHRDVKAENVLVSVQRCKSCAQLGVMCNQCSITSKLADFADAFQLPQDSSVHGGFGDAPETEWGPFGTTPYACPEFESGTACPFGISADMWALGILAVEVANMRLPKTDKDAPGSMSVNPYANPPRPLFIPRHDAAVVDEVPVWLPRIIEGCLREQRERRITAVDVLALLPTNDKSKR